MVNFKTLIAAGALALAPILAPAASEAGVVDLAAEGYAATGTVFSIGSMSTNVISGGFSGFNLATGSAINGSTATDVATYSINFGAGFLSPGDALTASVGINSNFGPIPLEMIFASASGTGAFAAADGEAILVSLNDPNLSFTDGYSGTATSTTVTVLTALAPIPLPAGGLLLLSAGGAFVMLRKKQSA